MEGNWNSAILPWIKSKVFTKSSSFLAALMLANVVAYLYYVLLARMMAPAEYGVVVTLTSASYLLDVVMRSIQSTLTKTMGSMGPGATRQTRAVFLTAMKTLLPMACLVIVAVGIASGWATEFLNLENNTPIILLAIYAALHFLAPVPRGILLGVGQPGKASAAIIVEPVIRLVAGAILVLLGMKAIGGLAGYIMGAILSFVFGIALIWSMLATGKGHEKELIYAEGWDRFAVQVLIMNACLMVMSSLDQIMVKHYFPPDLAGDFAATSILGRVLVMSGISIGIVVFTRSATLLQGNPDSQAFAKGLLAMGLVAFLALGLAFAAPTAVVGLTAGSQYQFAHAYLVLVAFETSLFGFIYIQANYHASMGRMVVTWPLAIACLLEVGLVAWYHASIEQILFILIAVMAGTLVYLSSSSWSILRGRSPMPQFDEELP